jgi:hypothetical protein
MRIRACVIPPRPRVSPHAPRPHTKGSPIHGWNTLIALGTIKALGKPIYVRRLAFTGAESSSVWRCFMTVKLELTPDVQAGLLAQPLRADCHLRLMLSRYCGSGSVTLPGPR